MSKHKRSLRLKKFLSVILSTGLVAAAAFGLTAVSFAGEDPVSDFAGLQAAVAGAATDGTETTIEVSGDITATAAITVPAGAEVIITSADAENPAVITMGTSGFNLFTVSAADTSLELTDIILDGNGEANKGSQTFAYSSGGTITIGEGAVLRNNVNTSNKLGGGATAWTGGTIVLDGGTVTGNSSLFGGGLLARGGTVVIKDGTVSNNTASSGGGGAAATPAGSAITMDGGEITGNTALDNAQFTGGGVFVTNSAVFTMNGGTISDNKAEGNNGFGGGVNITQSAEFIMNDGVITGNTAGSWGGGFNLATGTVTLKGGEIYGNADASGGKADWGYVSGGTFNIDGEISVGEGESLYLSPYAMNISINVTENGVLNIAGTVTATINNSGEVNLIGEGNVDGTVSGTPAVELVPVSYTVQHWTGDIHQEADDVVVTDYVKKDAADADKILTVTEESLAENTYDKYVFDGIDPAVEAGDTVTDGTVIKIIYKENHVWNEYYTIDKPATYTEAGSKSIHCADCDAVKDVTEIAKVTSVKLSSTTYSYNGGVKTPVVTVKDSKGKTLKKDTDYTVSYASGRKNVGTYKVTIALKGDYSDSKSLSFKINPKTTSIKKVTKARKAFTVKWKKRTTQVSGYQIMYSTSSKFKSGNKYVTIKSNKTTSKKVTKLKAKKKYYVKVRTYKTVNGTKYYSGWSSVKTVKTK